MCIDSYHFLVLLTTILSCALFLDIKRAYHTREEDRLGYEDIRLAQFERFFTETYIRKLSGKRMDKDLQLYHFRHVCVKRGAEGIYVGLKGVIDTLPLISKTDHISPRTWNLFKNMSDSKKERMLRSYEAKTLDMSAESFSKVTLLSGSVYFLNCETPRLDYRYQSLDFMSRFGILYELGSYIETNKERNSSYKSPLKTPFHHVMINRCSYNDIKSPWEITNLFFEIVKEKAEQSQLTAADIPTSYIREDRNESSTELVCMEDVYISTRFQSILKSQQNLIDFRKSVAEKHLADAKLRMSYKDEIPVSIANEGLYQSYCSSRSPRITVLDVIDSSNPVKITNIDALVRFLRKLTTKPILVATVRRDRSILEFLRIVNSSDIIVTTPGPHLIHGLLVARPYTKTVVEITPFFINDYHYHPFRRDYGFAEYMISTGHFMTGNSSNCKLRTIRDFQQAQCNISHHSYKNYTQDRFICPKYMLPSLLYCNIEVRLAQLRQRLL